MITRLLLCLCLVTFSLRAEPPEEASPGAEPAAESSAYPILPPARPRTLLQRVVPRYCLRTLMLLTAAVGGIAAVGKYGVEEYNSRRPAIGYSRWDAPEIRAHRMLNTPQPTEADLEWVANNDRDARVRKAAKDRLTLLKNNKPYGLADQYALYEAFLSKGGPVIPGFVPFGDEFSNAKALRRVAVAGVGSEQESLLAFIDSKRDFKESREAGFLLAFPEAARGFEDSDARVAQYLPQVLAKGDPKDPVFQNQILDYMGADWDMVENIARPHAKRIGPNLLLLAARRGAGTTPATRQEILDQVRGQKFTPAFFQELGELTRDKDPRVRSAAFELTGLIGNERFAEAVIAGISDPDRDVREKAARGLALVKRGDPRAIAAAKKAVQTQDFGVMDAVSEVPWLAQAVEEDLLAGVNKPGAVSHLSVRALTNIEGPMEKAKLKDLVTKNLPGLFEMYDTPILGLLAKRGTAIPELSPHLYQRLKDPKIPFPEREGIPEILGHTGLDAATAAQAWNDAQTNGAFARDAQAVLAHAGENSRATMATLKRKLPQSPATAGAAEISLFRGLVNSGALTVEETRQHFPNFIGQGNLDEAFEKAVARDPQLLEDLPKWLEDFKSAGAGWQNLKRLPPTRQVTGLLLTSLKQGSPTAKLEANFRLRTLAQNHTFESSHHKDVLAGMMAVERAEPKSDFKNSLRWTMEHWGWREDGRERAPAPDPQIGEHLPTLEREAADPNRKAWVADALGVSVKRADVAGAVARLAESPDPERRRTAAAALRWAAETDPAFAQPLLLKLSNDWNPQIRNEAASALSHIDSPEAAGRLIELVRENPGWTDLLWALPKGGKAGALALDFLKNEPHIPGRDPTHTRAVIHRIQAAQFLEKE